MLKFSVFIPTYNAANWLENCLESIFRQDYPRAGIEVLVVDGGSTDGTVEIAERFGARVLPNPQKLAHYAFRLFGEQSTGDLVVMFAADNELAGTQWFRVASESFIRFPELGALWGRQVSGPQDAAVNRYYELIQNDPLSFYCNKNLETYLQQGRHFEVEGLSGHLFNVDTRRPLVWGANGLVLRMVWVRSYFIAESFVGDNDIFQNMIEAGHTQTAFIPQLQTVHHHIRSVSEWTRKLRRNFRQHFLQHHDTRNMGWAFGKSFYLRLVLWVLYAGIPIFSGADALLRTLRQRNRYWLYHPLLNFIQLYTYASLTLGTPEGRQFLQGLTRKRLTKS